VSECATVDSLEVFVADDAFEGGAVGERQPFDDFELIGEGDASESGTVLECALADSFEAFVEEDAFEGRAIAECRIFDDFELIRKSDTREGVALFE